MTLPVFHLPDATPQVGEEFDLDGAEGRHAAVVRRIGPGEQIQVTDGRGHVATCDVVGVSKSGLTLVVRETDQAARPAPEITVVQAIPKGERAELTVEVLTEVGADTIVPWAASRSVGQWRGERGAKALAKWRTTAREAAKQSRRTWFPEVTDQADLGAVVDVLHAADVALVLHEDATEPLDAVDLTAATTIAFVIGPEGGINDDEIETMTAAGAHVVRLGTTVLRTSTAGVAAVAAVLARTRWA